MFFSCLSAQDLTYYLPDSLTYNPEIPTPKSVLGFEVGEFYADHQQVLHYMRILAQTSERITLEEYGKTYEHKPLILLKITTPQNHQNLDIIQKKHIQLTNPNISHLLDIHQMPLVVWLGYGVHGDEASATNSALLAAYYLAAAQGEKIDQILRNTVIILDPCYNPDGFNRFTNWVNTNRSKNLITDPASREFHQPFPTGRTNHYLFDLNRDWIPLQLAESQARMRKFHEWKPNILTDHHEMGKNATFFFQPGVIARTNPLTPTENQELTEKIAYFHAQFLDRIGSLYYSKEDFDDFYFGKGSTYPDIHGAVGILFEQASARGFAQETKNGILRFPFTIRNQFTVMLSTLEAGANLRLELLNFQRDFYQKTTSLADQNPIKGYIFGDEHDLIKNLHFVQLLLRHHIKVYENNQNNTIHEKIFKKSKSYIVPLKQPQYHLIRSLFETQTKFQDSLFYDVSTWCMPLAFDIPYTSFTEKNNIQISENQCIDKVNFPKSEITESTKNYAFLVDWKGYDAPKFLYKIQNYGLLTKVSQQEFSIKINQLTQHFERGTIIIPSENQYITPDSVAKIVRKVSQECQGLKIWQVATGKTQSGIDLGSNQIKKLTKPSVLLVVGEGVRDYDAGEIWFLNDQKFNIPTVLVDIEQLSKVDLSRYTTIIFVHGNYGMMASGMKDELRYWLRKGGTMLLFKEATRWGMINRFNNLTFKVQNPNSNISIKPLTYETQDNQQGAQRIGGAIFETKVDLTHPLLFGYQRDRIPVFKNENLCFEVSQTQSLNPIQFTKKPLLSGYVSKSNLQIIQNAAFLEVSTYGKGTVISFADNPNFRAFWYGTTKLFINCLFFGNISNKNY